MAARTRIVILGAGFGGLTAARTLAAADADVLVVDSTNHHLFQPLLYQVATAMLDPSEVAHPTRGILRRQRNCDVLMARAQGIDLEGRRLLTDRGPVPYDHLIVAAGAVTDDLGKPGVAEYAFGLKSLGDSIALRNHILGCVERAVAEPDAVERDRLLTIAIAGGGPTGVELAGSISELVGLVLPRDFPSLDVRHHLRIVLVEGTGSVLGAFHPRLRRAAERTLRRKGVELRLNTLVDDADAQGLRLAGGGRVDAATLIWTVGVRGAAAGGLLADRRVRSRRIPVERDLRLAGHPEVAVIGDLAYLEQDGAALPMLAPVAIQQGRWVARRIAAELAGSPPPAPFRYRDKGTMATIGRNSAIAEIGPVRLSGFVGWVMWLGLHLIQIVGFRNKLATLLNWAWDYLRVDRPVRLIVVPHPPPGVDRPAG